LDHKQIFINLQRDVMDLDGLFDFLIKLCILPNVDSDLLKDLVFVRAFDAVVLPGLFVELMLIVLADKAGRGSLEPGGCGIPLGVLDLRSVAAHCIVPVQLAHVVQEGVRVDWRKLS